MILALVLSATAFATEYTVLSKGSKDGEGIWSVYSLQARLKELYFISSEADGSYGQGTEDAVKAFQEANGLNATGIADVETQELLFSDSATPSGTVAPTSTPEGTVISDGADGNDVYIIQSYMYIWGFTSSTPDGKFGSATREALAEFMNYSFTNMQSYTTAIRAAATPTPTPLPTPEPSPGEMADVEDVALTPEPTIPVDGTITDEWFSFIENAFNPASAVVAVGSSGEDVLRMQRRLFALKYIAAGVDGGFGSHTEVALKYFQQRNGLEETGILDTNTQAALYSNNAMASDQYITLYMAKVSIKDQRVYIYEWTGTGYTKLAHTFVCSTGTEKNPTILGTFQAAGRNGEWYYFEDSNVWARYAFVINGGYFFHSVLYEEKNGDPTSSSVRNLGTRASHGCIRLAVEDAKWIYDNCVAGMTVEIYDD